MLVKLDAESFLVRLNLSNILALDTDIPRHGRSSSAAEHLHHELPIESELEWPHEGFPHGSDDEQPPGYPLHQHQTRATDRHAIGHGPRIGRRIASEFYKINPEDWRRRVMTRSAL